MCLFFKYKFKITLFLLICNFANIYSEDVLIWGPGLRPIDIVMPATYFFLQVDNSSQVAKLDDLYVAISGDSESGSCRLWVEKLDRKDDSFIVRYRLYESCTNFKINVTYKKKHVGMSPYTYTGYVLHDNCDCPSANFETWAENYQCPKQLDQIVNDMRPFQNVNMSNVLLNVMEKYNSPGSISICHYLIKNNQLYRKCYGQHVGFNMFSDAILLSVLRKVKLPDISFLINLGDWPLVKKHSKVIPVFSWCGSDDTNDIVLPTYDLTESTLENMGRVMLDMLSVQGNIGKQWSEKIPKAIWRGRDSCRERLKLIEMGREHPELYNVSLTNFFFFRDQEKIYGPKVPHISFFKFFDYKYQINIDGTVAAYRFPYLLVGDSLVFKQDSLYYEHFYKQLQPGVHYVPVQRDLSDLTEKLQWAINNDDQAKIISKNGRDFARNFLMPQDIICYYANALNEWKKHIVGPVEFYGDMEKISQTSEDKMCPCAESSKSYAKDEF